MFIPAITGVSPLAPPVPIPPFTISSSSIVANQPIDIQYTLYGANISPQLAWQNAPAGTEAFSVIVFDTDANFYHWKVRVPKTTSSLGENAGVAGGVNLPAGSMRFNNDFFGSPYGAGTDYDGPRPPAGSGVHHYNYTVHALDGTGNAITSATITGTYVQQ